MSQECDGNIIILIGKCEMRKEPAHSPSRDEIISAESAEFLVINFPSIIV